jgi:hypothetical protein
MENSFFLPADFIQIVTLQSGEVAQRGSPDNCRRTIRHTPKK